MEQSTHNNLNHSHYDCEYSRTLTVGTANGKVVGIKRNFGLLPLKDALERVVVRQLTQSEGNPT